ncbi:transketolase [Candidatus Atribacteria bacterium RBG_19FT_COMBO_35_14]|uniref:Transketolase n=1 Tax=Candidatus Sediminicultor quintus TaxID=1797291 RepID=A0A1F5ADX2_9BACT|nr:MAG: transketolase [Candidatus Atribacteria bacterium RBG_19FT_COMBO_35_14]
MVYKERWILVVFQEELIKDLEKKANIIRRYIIEMISNAEGGHIGGALSITDIMAVLYFHILKIDPENPEWEDRDRVILSKGHASAAWYAALAERGYFPKEELLTFDHINSRLQGHPDMNKTPGVDMSSGSLGQGISVALGMALAARYLKKIYRTFVILGDGETQEGQIWEAAMVAANYSTDNLIAILDYNKLQLYGETNTIMNIEPVIEKWRVFGWNTIEINGHRINEIVQALEEAVKFEGKPTIIIAHTIKGKGVSFMENKVEWHSLAPTKEQAKQALKELGYSNEKGF